MVVMTRDAAMRAVSSFDWGRIGADPDDVKRLRRAVMGWVAAEEGSADEFMLDAIDVSARVASSEEGVAPLFELFLELARAEGVTRPEYFLAQATLWLVRFRQLRATPWLDALLQKRARLLSRCLREGCPPLRVAAATLVAVAGASEHTAQVERLVHTEVIPTPDLARVLLALVTLHPERARSLGERFHKTESRDLRVAAAGCLRLAASNGERLPPLLARFADEHGHPAWLERVYPPPLEVPAPLREIRPLAPDGEFERAKVVLSTSSLLVVHHPIRGNFTFPAARGPLEDSGLSRGDGVELADFLAPPEHGAQRIRFAGRAGLKEVAVDPI